RASRCPVLIGLDDLHLADDATIALLRHINRFVADKPVLVVATTREPDVAALGDVMPLDVVPQIDAVAAPLPTLSDDARRVADVASLFETWFSERVVMDVAEVEDDEIFAELIESGPIYSEDGERYRFTDRTHRRMTHDAMDAATREELHAAIAERLAVRPPVSALAALEIAWHYSRAAEPIRVLGVTHAMSAAESATASGQHQLAVDALRLSRSIAPEDDDRRPHIEARLGLAIAWTLQPDEAAKTILSATGEIEASEGADAALGYLATAAELLTSATGHETAVPFATEGLRLAGSSRDWRWLMMMHLDSVRHVEDEEHPGVEVNHEHVEALRQLAMVSTDPDDEHHVDVL